MRQAWAAAYGWVCPATSLCRPPADSGPLALWLADKAAVVQSLQQLEQRKETVRAELARLSDQVGGLGEWPHGA